MNTKLSLVIPIYNEAEMLPELKRRLMASLDALGLEREIVVVDDASSDKTFEILRNWAESDPRVKIIRFARNFGHQSAVTAGMDYATGDAVVVMDGDLQDPPERIADFVSRWRDGYDVVYGIRKKRKEWWGKRLAYYVFYRLMRAGAHGVEMPVDAGDFGLMSRRVVDAIRALPERGRYVRGLRSWVGFKQIGIPYERDKRYAGTPKYTFVRLLKLARDGIFSFSVAPLQIITGLGIVISFCSFLSILFVLYLRLFTDKSIPGFASLAIIILFLGGIQLLSLGIIGEYVGRVYDESKRRPQYIVDEKIGFDA